MPDRGHIFPRYPFVGGNGGGLGFRLYILQFIPRRREGGPVYIVRVRDNSATLAVHHSRVALDTSRRRKWLGFVRNPAQSIGVFIVPVLRIDD